MNRKTDLQRRIAAALAEVDTGPNPDRLLRLVVARLREKATQPNASLDQVDDTEVMIAYIETVIAAYQKQHVVLSNLRGPSYGALPYEILAKYGKNVMQKQVFEEARASARRKTGEEQMEHCGPKCSVCARDVLSMTEVKARVHAGVPLVELVDTTGLECSSCGTISCQSCAHDAAKARGNDFFTCPSCKANINDCQIR